MILWIKYTGNIQFSLEHRVVYISTIYYVFIIWLYFTPNFIFLYSYNYIICMGGCSHTVCLWMFAPDMNSTPWNSYREPGQRPHCDHLRSVALGIRNFWASAMWPESHIIVRFEAIRRRRNLKLGTHVEHRGGWKMLGADFWICPWLTP